MKREDVPRMMGTGEIAKRLGVTPARVAQITDSIGAAFPRPVQRLMQGQIWLADEVEEWIRQHRPDIAEDSEGEEEGPNRTDPGEP